MGAADGDRQGVSCVGRHLARPRQKPPHHERDLALIRPAGSNDGLLDLAGGEFRHPETGRRQGGERRPARLTEEER